MPADASTRKIRVLIVDDSPTALRAISHLIAQHEGFEVVDAIDQPEEILGAVELLAPDVIAMDLAMPGIDGVKATRQIMKAHPTPILIVTGLDSSQRNHLWFQALQAGAVDLVTKESLMGAHSTEASRQQFLRKLRVVAGVPVMRRFYASGKLPAVPPAPPGASSHCKLLAIGASTGGPVALQGLLQALPKPFPLPILIIQHIGDAFLDGFVSWLHATTAMPASVARAGTILRPGEAHVAPGGRHAIVAPDFTVALDDSPPLNACRPSIDRLFFSIAQDVGAAAIGVLLTGMGRDGALGLKAMRDAGAHTIVQDEETSVIFGMPGEACKLGAYDQILPIHAIAGAIVARLQAVASDHG